MSQRPENDFKMLTTDEVAEILRLKAKTVREMIQRGELPHVMVGREYRILWKDVKKWIDDHYNPGQ